MWEYQLTITRYLTSFGQSSTPDNETEHYCLPTVVQFLDNYLLYSSRRSYYGRRSKPCPVSWGAPDRKSRHLVPILQRWPSCRCALNITALCIAYCHRGLWRGTIWPTGTISPCQWLYPVTISSRLRPRVFLYRSNDSRAALQSGRQAIHPNT